MSVTSQRQAGFSVIEILTVLTIMGLVLSLAVPKLTALVQRQRLQGAGESFRSDLHLARMQALGTGRSVRVAFQNGVSGSCYVVFQGEADGCRCDDGGAPQCTPGSRLVNHQWAPATRGVRILANVAQLTIDGQRGTVTPTTTVRLSDTQGTQMAHVVAVTGRVRTCGEAGYQSPVCPS